MVKPGGKLGRRMGVQGDGTYGVCACFKENSDGTEYEEDFGAALDGGWSQKGSSSTWRTESGILVVDTVGDNPDESLLYRSASNTAAPVKIIMQITVTRRDSETTQQGMEFDQNIATGTIGFNGNSSFGFYVDWSVSKWLTLADGSQIEYTTPTPAGGEVLTLIVKRAAGANSRACFYVDDTLIRDATLTNNRLTSYTESEYGIYILGGTMVSQELGDFDNFSIQIDT